MGHAFHRAGADESGLDEGSHGAVDVSAYVGEPVQREERTERGGNESPHERDGAHRLPGFQMSPVEPVDVRQTLEAERLHAHGGYEQLLQLLRHGGSEDGNEDLRMVFPVQVPNPGIAGDEVSKRARRGHVLHQFDEQLRGQVGNVGPAALRW